MIQRYYISAYAFTPKDEGDWVRFSDHDADIAGKDAEISALRERLARFEPVPGKTLLYFCAKLLEPEVEIENSARRMVCDWLRKIAGGEK